MKPSENRVRNFLEKLFSAPVDLLYPHRCPACRVITSDDAFCQSCWEKLSFIEGPCCFVCGEPLSGNYDGNLLCAVCLKEKRSFDRLFSVFVYNKTIAKAIYRFKFKRQAFLAKFFLKFLLKKLKSMGDPVDLLVPVPIYIKRLKWRGYNQTLLLAQEISKKTSIAYAPNLLLKKRHTAAQTSLHFSKRKSNLTLAFDMANGYESKIVNKNIMIIDDVFTTGSTVNECAKILKKNGAGRVFVLTIAKTMLSKRIKIMEEILAQQ
ncbi:MAG: ComF family protein [Rickettsiales bacterium]|nr:ComF family protein [Rickettsiales bacterium]